MKDKKILIVIGALVACCFLFWLLFGGNSSEIITSPSGQKSYKIIHYNNIFVGDYTVFTPEINVGYYKLPDTFLLATNKWNDGWNCLLQWNGNLLEIYTSDEEDFKASNLDNTTIVWTEMDAKMFSSLYYDENGIAYIRYASKCHMPSVKCL